MEDYGKARYRHRNPDACAVISPAARSSASTRLQNMPKRCATWAAAAKARVLAEQNPLYESDVAYYAAVLRPRLRECCSGRVGLALIAPFFAVNPGPQGLQPVSICPGDI